MGELKVGQIQAKEKLRAFWPQLEPFITKALARANGEMLSVDIYERLLEGNMQLWIVADGTSAQFQAIAVTEHSWYPRKRVVRVVLLAGVRMHLWQEALDEVLSDYARQMGANTLEMVGRRGFVRQLAPLGFKERYTTMTKELD